MAPNASKIKKKKKIKARWLPLSADVSVQNLREYKNHKK